MILDKILKSLILLGIKNNELVIDTENSGADPKVTFRLISLMRFVSRKRYGFVINKLYLGYASRYELFLDKYKYQCNPLSSFDQKYSIFGIDTNFIFGLDQRDSNSSNYYLDFYEQNGGTFPDDRNAPYSLAILKGLDGEVVLGVY